MSHPRSDTLHATALSIGGDGLLLTGPSGSGKSDLALRCLSMSQGIFLEAPFELVSDDQSIVSLVGDTVEIEAPAAIAGKLEVRGVGIVDVPNAQKARLRLVVRLTEHKVERSPALAACYQEVLGLSFPKIQLRPFEPSAPLKLALALRQHSDLAAL